MAQLKKSLEWKNKILEMVNNFYVNFLDNVKNYYSVPNEVVEYNKKNNSFKDVKQMKEFVAVLEEVKNMWKTFGTTNEITPIYFQLVFVNACNLIESMEANLEQNEIKGDVISTTNGIDVVASTTMQILATIGMELVDKYNRFELENDQKQIFNHVTSNLNNILNQNSQEAFSNLLDNVMQFISSYKQLERKMAEVPELPGASDPFEGPRTQLYISWCNGYIILAMCLNLLLVYPFENGMMPEPAFLQMRPVIDIF